MQIAKRALKLQDGSGETELAIRIFAPQQDGVAWSCRYEIDWPEGMQRANAFGIDSVQAIVIALQMVGADIYTSTYHKSGKLSFTRPGGGYGFPVPISLRELLIGDDANQEV